MSTLPFSRPSFPAGNGEMARRVRDHPWGETPLGPIEAWPDALKAIVDVVLSSGFPTIALWGQELIQIYNDGYRDLMGTRHLAGLGQPTYDCWPEVWHINAPIYARVWTGETVTIEDVRYPITCSDVTRNAWFTLSYSPLRDSSGVIVGILVMLFETTARHRADERCREVEGHLLESEARHRLLIESWAQAVWETDANGVVIADSPSWRAYTGQTLEAWRGYGWLDAVHPDDRLYAEAQWRAAVAAGRLVDAEYRLRAPQDGWRWTNVRAAPVLDPQGRVEKWVGMNIDIDARKRAETALREKEERLRGVLDGMAEGFGLLAPDFTILEHNVEALRLDGRRRDEIVGRSHWDVYPDSRDTDVGRLLNQAMTERVPVSLDHQYAFGSGPARWLHMRAYPTAGGALAVFWSDVTEQRAAEIARQESAARYRTLFESMDEAYAVVEVLKDDAGASRGFRFVEVNQAFIGHTSLPCPIGQTATDLLSQPNPRWTQLYGQALDTGKPVRVEEGEARLERVFDLNIFPLDHERNQVAVLFTDITERKRADIAMCDNEHRLELLVAELQHRTRNLLAVVGGIADQCRATSDTLDDFGVRFDRRLAALGRVQGLLSAVPLPGIPFTDLLILELVAHGIDPASNSAISLSGPDVALPPDTVQLLALALHELTTNALKHGALMTGGRVDVEWTERGASGGVRVLALRWTEHGVPRTEGLIRRGFGRQLIETDLPYELDATTRLEFGADGVSCLIELRLPPA